MPGDRAKKHGNTMGRDYWSRRNLGNMCAGYPTSTHADPLSTKRMTRRYERRQAKQLLSIGEEPQGLKN